MRFDITKVRKPTLSESIFGVPREKDPPVFHGMKVPSSLKKRMKAAGNKKVLMILSEHLPE